MPPPGTRSTSSSSQPSEGANLMTSYQQIRSAEVEAVVEAHLEAKLKVLLQDFQAEMLQALKVDIKEQLDKFQTAVDITLKEFKASLNDLQNSVSFNCGEVEKAQKEIVDLRAAVGNATARADEANSLARESLKRCKDLELAHKKTNIVVFGVANDSVDPDQESVLKSFLCSELGVVNCDNILFKDVFRMGQFVGGSSKPRPMKVQFVRMCDKRAVMSKYLADRKALIDGGVRIRDDLPFEIRVFRTTAYKLFNRLFQANKKPRFVPDGVECDRRVFHNIASFRAYVDSFPVVVDESES